MKKLTAGIIGMGGMGKRYHFPALKKHPDISKILICDSNPPAVIQAGMDLGIGKTCQFTDADKMLEEGVDIVTIATPNNEHAPLAIKALKAGAHVFVEKPPAINAAQTKEMVSVAAAQDRLISVDCNNRKRQEVEAFLLGTNLGHIAMAQAGWIRFTGIPGARTWFTNKKMAGGGALIDLGIHMMDLVLKKMGYPKPVATSATWSHAFKNDPGYYGPWGAPGPKDNPFDVETAVQGIIIFEGGTSVLIRFSWAENIRHEDVYCKIQGVVAGVDIGRVFDIDGIDATAHDHCTTITVQKGQPYKTNWSGIPDQEMGRTKMVKAFVDAVVTGKPDPLLPTPEEMVRMMEIVDGIYISCETGETYTFPV